MSRKDPHAVALGKRGGRANTPAQAIARARNARKGGAPRLYRLTADRGLERQQGGRWLVLEPPYDAAAKAYLRRLRPDSAPVGALPTVASRPPIVPTAG